MKIAIVYNRDSQAVINLFGIPNREKYGLKTIQMIRDAIKQGGFQVKTFEGDKNLISNLEDFMPSVISGERPGLVFNLSYGIQGRARYTHVPGILEMLGIPYVGSGPETQAIALDKVVTKVILMHKGLPTPRFCVLEKADSPLTEDLSYPLIVKPKDESISLGLRIVHNEEELRAGVANIYEMFQAPTLVEEYIEGREINVGLLGNDPVQALPPVELDFGEGEQIFSYEDKMEISGRKVRKICPANLSEAEIERLQKLAIDAFKALGCFDAARVDFRLDKDGNPYILEINSLPSLGENASYVFGAQHIGLDYNALVNKLVEVAAQRYFGHPVTTLSSDETCKEKKSFHFLTKNRDKAEEELKSWTNLSSSTDDPAGLSAVLRRIGQRMDKLGFEALEKYTNGRSAWTWQTKAGLSGGTLLVVPVDTPRERGGFPVPFRRDPEWLFGEGIASSRAGLVCALQAFEALRSLRKLRTTPVGLFVYTDEGRGMRYSSSLLKQSAQEAGEVLVLQPGFSTGKVVDQRRGSRKYSLLVEGQPQRIGAKANYSDVLSWFLKKAEKCSSISQSDQKLSVVVQEVKSERFSVLMPHRVWATIYVTYMNEKLADKAEEQLKKLFNADSKGLQVYLEKLEERPSLSKTAQSNSLIEQLQQISEEWKLPFGLEGGLLPSAAGVVPENIPVLCGLAPASRDLYTPHEAIPRGELLQRTLLLSLFLLRKIK
ncbi:ATP-grasp domain-containing protein [Heliorestis acidaminivorans]|uniref:ATP-grasp domain-containing protein n=1 Tax=Heliorestis acidaminivorans TaxID=553427 RepID=A0A6I0F2W9_9FIRM|nr:ATP-grasp domain-containing protein [Heliorestis acidaminivorans]KAB2952708.1 ATP-grasp domain-containing protein [Heliorestis acidaminivorans]